MDKQDLKIRTSNFAHRCVKAALTIEQKNKLGKLIAYQLMRCSTSVAANYRAACLAHSKDAFAAKLGIVIEEVDEAEYWITFALEESLFKLKQVEGLIDESKELLAIFISPRKTIKDNKTALKSNNKSSFINQKL